ncbi:MAG: acetyltransferase [Oscillospiraceae bacterium]|nr:acetyltransferase [Oscillospiraceae bacterium]
MKLLIYCAGGLGREYCDVAERVNKQEHRWDEIAFIDDARAGDYYGKKTLTFADVCKLDRADCEFLVANGNPSTREKLFDKMKAEGFKGATVVDPNACVSPSATLKEGVLVSAHTLISSLSTLEENSLVLPCSVIGHDTVVGAHSFVCCDTAIGGNTKIGKRVYIGENAPVKENLTIGDDSIVSMGAVILRDVPESVIMFGNPARAMRNNDDKKVF